MYILVVLNLSKNITFVGSCVKFNPIILVYIYIGYAYCVVMYVPMLIMM